MSVSAAVRQRFMDGEILNSKKVQQEYGVSSGLLVLVIKDMQKDGYVFERTERREDRRVYADWKLKARVVGKGAKTTTVKREEIDLPPGPASTWKEPEVPEVQEQSAARNGRVELPQLGQKVTVSLLSVNEQGIVTMGLRGEGGRTWVVQLTGQTEKSN